MPLSQYSNAIIPNPFSLQLSFFLLFLSAPNPHAATSTPSLPSFSFERAVHETPFRYPLFTPEPWTSSFPPPPSPSSATGSPLPPVPDHNLEIESSFGQPFPEDADSNLDPPFDTGVIDSTSDADAFIDRTSNDVDGVALRFQIQDNGGQKSDIEKTEPEDILSMWWDAQAGPTGSSRVLDATTAPAATPSSQTAPSVTVAPTTAPITTQTQTIPSMGECEDA